MVYVSILASNLEVETGNAADGIIGYKKTHTAPKHGSAGVFNRIQRSRSDADCTRLHGLLREDNDISNRNCTVYDFESNYFDLEIKTRHEAVISPIDFTGRCELGCQPPRVEVGMWKSFTAVAGSCRTPSNLLIFYSLAFLRMFFAFFIPPRARAGGRGWQNVISNM